MAGNFSSFRSIWFAALACFVLAAAAGAWFRLGMLTGLPEGISLQNVRHAHSHLMYFGWVTPAVMALIAAHVAASDKMREVIWVILGLAVASFGSFLLYGYSLAPVGSMRLPLSVIVSTLNILAWYAFIVLYLQGRKTISSGAARRFWDGSVALLAIASLGAWGIGIVQATGPENPFWYHASLHLFLDLFAEGWLLLAILGFACAAIRPSKSRAIRRGFFLLMAGVPLTFLLSVRADVVPLVLQLAGSAGGALASLGLLTVLRALWQSASAGMRRLWLLPMAMLGLKALAQLAASIPGTGEWIQLAGLRVLYLHILLLGGVTLGLLSAANSLWRRDAAPGWEWVSAAVVFLLITLLPLSGLWPAGWGGRWVFNAAIAGAAIPLLAMTILLVRAWRATRARKQIPA